MRFFTFLLILSVFFSCGDDSSLKKNKIQENNQDVEPVLDNEAKIIEPQLDDEIVVLEEKGVQLVEIKTSDDRDAFLQLNTKQFKQGENLLSFTATGINDHSLSVIENNYTISNYKSFDIKKDFLFGNNVFLAFFTDNDGVSLKTNKAHVLKNIALGEESLFDMNAPHLFYHLPRQSLSKTILDFYLVNTSISKSGNKVKVIINDVAFVLSKWAAYEIKGLKSDKNTIRIQLINSKGDLIDGPFNDSGDRKF